MARKLYTLTEKQLRKAAESPACEMPSDEADPYQDIGACATAEEAEAEIADAQERTPYHLRRWFYSYILPEPLGGFYWGWVLRSRGR